MLFTTISTNVDSEQGMTQEDFVRSVNVIDGGDGGERSFAIETGFDLNPNIYEQRYFASNYTELVFDPMDGRIIGMFTVIASSFDSVDYNQYKSVAYRIDMYPQRQTWSCGLFGWSTCWVQGESHEIDAVSDINGEMLQRSPLTQPKTQTYSVGVGLNSSQLGLSASVSLTKEHLNLRGIHPNPNTFHANYEYRYLLLQNNDYLIDLSHQYGAFSFSQNNYTSLILDVDVTFIARYKDYALLSTSNVYRRLY